MVVGDVMEYAGRVHIGEACSWALRPCLGHRPFGPATPASPPAPGLGPGTAAGAWRSGGRRRRAVALLPRRHGPCDARHPVGERNRDQLPRPRQQVGEPGIAHRAAAPGSPMAPHTSRSRAGWISCRAAACPPWCAGAAPARARPTRPRAPRDRRHQPPRRLVLPRLGGELLVAGSCRREPRSSNTAPRSRTNASLAMRRTLRRDQAELRKMAAQRVDRLGALTDQKIGTACHAPAALSPSPVVVLLALDERPRARSATLRTWPRACPFRIEASLPLPRHRHGRRRPTIHEFLSPWNRKTKRGWSAFADHDGRERTRPKRGRRARTGWAGCSSRCSTCASAAGCCDSSR